MNDRKKKPADVPHIGEDDQMATPRQFNELPSLDQLTGLDKDIFDSLEIFFQRQRNRQ